MINQLNYAFWYELLPTVAGAALIPSAIAYFYKSNESGRIQIFSILYSISLLATVTGQITGQSREPAVAAVMPAILGLIGGVSIYILIAKDAQQQMLAAILVILFTGHLLSGIFVGREFRKVELSEKEQFGKLMRQELAEHRVAMEMLKLEVILRTEREILGLPSLENGED